MESGVEAGNARDAGQCPRGRGHAGQGTRLMQRGQVSQVADCRGDALVNEHGRAEPAAPMHDAVTRDCDIAAGPGQEVRQLGVVRAAIPWVELESGFDGVTRSEDCDLQAARSGVEHDRGRGVGWRHRGGVIVAASRR